MRGWVAGLALALAGCGLGGSPTMKPGSDCLRCHGGGRGGGGDGEGDAKPWTVAGTVFPALDSPTSAGVLGAQVHIRDATGWNFQLQTNIAGNFYTAEPVTFPIRIQLEYGGAVVGMNALVEEGGCNGCHGWPGSDGAAGRIAVP